MNSIVYFDTCYGSLNLGDWIIQEAIEREMRFLNKSAFCAHYPTHTPIEGGLHALLPVLATRTCTSADLKFINGTNIVKTDLFKFARDWHVNLVNKRLYKDAVLIGCGREVNSRRMNRYTRAIYNTVLSKRFAHSVRDRATYDLVTSLGVRAIMTGCPTTWSLDQARVDETYDAPATSCALFTLTDYQTSPDADRALVRHLARTYDHLLFWPQGSRDYAYFESLGLDPDIEVVAPSFAAYKEALATRDFDYVGTRLHAGIYALSNSHRSCIVSVDNRASDMAASIGLHIVPRGDLAALDRMIRENAAPVVDVPKDAVQEWKDQFSGYVDQI
jgi:hypothetical protein